MASSFETTLFPIVQTINEYLSNYVLVFLLLGVGIWYTIKTHCVQVRCFKEGWNRVFGNITLNGKKGGGGMSSFQALATAIAAQVGTGNIVGACGAILIGVPIGFLTAVYLAKVASPRIRSVMSAAVSLLAGIPSVVYGLVGMLVLVPGIRKVFHLADGASLLAAIVVLAIMILPSIIKVSVTALEAVPHEYEDASLALGATPIETYFRVSVPAAKSGIAAAVVLGVGRAIGEAMAVMMVSGNVSNMPTSIFESVRFLTTAVASEMSYSSGLQHQALFSIALVLYLFILLINAALNFFLKRDKEGN